MPKIIASQSVAAQKEAEAMRAQIEQLRAENWRLKSDNARLSKATRGIHSAKAPSAASPVTTPTTSSYALPTAASSSREKKVKASKESKPGTQIDAGQSPYWQDGKLVRVGEDPRAFGFKRHTVAFQHKARYIRDNLWGIPDGPDERETLWELEHQKTTESGTEQEVEADCPLCNDIEDAWDDESADSLCARSGLDDNAFIMGGRAKCGEKALMMVNIPMKTQVRILKAGHALAQDIIWHHVRRHWPEVQRRWWMESPREVKLGRDELMAKFGAGDMLHPSSQYSRICNVPTGSINYAILQLPQLRNTVCHQSHCMSFEIDALLADVQRVAVVLQDEPRALKVRALRDEVKREAQKSLLEIESFLSSSWLPENSMREWPLHHQRTFSDAIVAFRHDYHSDYHRLPAFFKNAVWEWRMSTHAARPGRQNREYRANVKKAQSRVRLVPKVPSAVSSPTGCIWSLNGMAPVYEPHPTASWDDKLEVPPSCWEHLPVVQVEEKDDRSLGNPEVPNGFWERKRRASFEV